MADVVALDNLTLRMYILDAEVERNILLDDLEFKDEELNASVQQTLNLWNETPPELCPKYDRTNFPWPHHLAIGSIARLLRMTSHRYRRNTLAVQVGGAAVDDQNKEKEYKEAAKEMDQEFRQWMMHKKIEIQTANTWGFC